MLSMPIYYTANCHRPPKEYPPYYELLVVSRVNLGRVLIDILARNALIKRPLLLFLFQESEEVVRRSRRTRVLGNSRRFMHRCHSEKTDGRSGRHSVRF